ncbi:histidine kinase [Streptomyces albus subsp. chlorinus]|uniref:sensor histidine kinase n=1 Tax=Streptomyces albus TaxID=1888 RepID=UPI001FAD2815|nr:histidine kinase [Streptomyces albus]
MTSHSASVLARRLLPGELTASGPPRGGRVRRSARDWVVDVALFAGAVLCWLALYDQVGAKTYLPGWLLALDPPLGALACLSLWVRRRWPLGVALAAVPAAALTDTVFGALAVIIFNLALRVAPRTALLVLALHLGATLPYVLLYGVPHDERWTIAAFVVVYYLLFFAWGSLARVRRQLVLKLREDAVRAQADHERRLADVRRAERRAIAREMHDVLAHRVSLLSVHAGALAYRTQRTAAGEGAALDDSEIAESATVIRDNAHQALEELRDVLHVLREDEAEDAAREAGGGAARGGVTGPERAARPQPDLSRIGELVDEARAAGQTVRLDEELSGPAGGEGGLPLRPQLQRTAYRAVQEGLTNARKHAPGQPVEVRVAGAVERGLTVRVSNPLPAGAGGSGIPGAGAGLTGLRERLEIEGGTLSYGPQEGAFVLLAHLPWPPASPADSTTTPSAAHDAGLGHEAEAGHEARSGHGAGPSGGAGSGRGVGSEDGADAGHDAGPGHDARLGHEARSGHGAGSRGGTGSEDGAGPKGGAGSRHDAGP